MSLRLDLTPITPHREYAALPGTITPTSRSLVPNIPVNKNKKRGDEIKQQLEDRRAGRTKGSSEQQGLKNKLAELRGQFQAVLVRLGAA